MNRKSILEVIETKRKPPLWSVKAGKRYVAAFSGAGAREKAEALASEIGGYTVKTKPELAAERPAWRRRAKG
jgi:hypothetical protein